MEPRQLKEILEKREEILKINHEYIEVHDDNDCDDVSNTEKVPPRYNFGKNIHDLTETIKLHLEIERTRKVNWAIATCFMQFVGISGLIVLNDYILLNYFV